MAVNLVMLGPPGAGKGTQAERFARRSGVPKISTGDILREAGQAGTPIGLRAKSIMDRGELVPDDVMIEIVRERLNRPDASRGFVLDGFPRTVPQARALDGLMNGRSPLVIVDIAVPEDVLVRRLGSRLVCSVCGANAESFDAPPDQSQEAGCRSCGGRLVQRSDDSEPVVRERLRVYRRDTQPLLEYYRARPTFRSIDGAQPADRVAIELAAAVESTVNRDADFPVTEPAR
jgi:adenylate kinase